MQKGQMAIILIKSLFFITFCIACIVIFPAIRLSSDGAGKHTGYVSAIEQHGFFFQNYNVYVKTDPQSSQEDIYCLDRSQVSLAQKIQQLSTGRKIVIVSYIGARGFLGWGACSGDMITNVELQ